MTLIYCYGITDEQVTLTSEGFLKGKVYTIKHKNIYAVVSDVSEAEFSQEAINKKILDLEWLKTNGPLHEKIVSEINQKTQILPMKFCTIFDSKSHIEDMLKVKYADANYFLHYTKGKEEMSLKVYCNINKLETKLKDESEELQKLGAEITGKSEGQAYFLNKKIELLLKERVQRKIADVKSKIIKELEQNTEVKRNESISKKITGKDMVLNLALLVTKGSDTNKLLEPLVNEFQNFKFELSGPFAPYHFIM
jgi:hypothetical protein